MGFRVQDLGLRRVKGFCVVKTLIWHRQFRAHGKFHTEAGRLSRGIGHIKEIRNLTKMIRRIRKRFSNPHLRIHHPEL